MHGRVIDGAKLRALRQQAGLYMADLAAKVKCSKGHIRNMETAGDQPGPELAHRLAHALTEALGHPVTLDDFSTLVADDRVGAA